MGEITLFLQILICIIFLCSGITKLIDFKSFSLSVVDLGFPTKIAQYVAFLVLGIELILSILILIPSTNTIGCLLLFFLLCSFIIVTITSIKKKSQVKCNCFGKLSNEKIGYATLIRCILLLLISVLLFFNLSFLDLISVGASEIVLITFSSLGMFLIYLILMMFKDTISE